MANINIEKYNNVYAKVICEEPAIEQEIADFFTFEVPGAKWSPAYKKRHWDGKTRLFSLKTKLIYLGLVKHLIAFAQLNKYSYAWEEPKASIVNTANYVKSLNIPNIEVRDYQLFASSWALTNKRCLLLSPTASGKSLIIYIIARHLLQHKQQGLLIVPTTSLVEQMYGDFHTYGWDVERNCQKIYYGFDKQPTQPLVISTWQSLYDMPKPYFTQFDFIIGDEAHGFQSKSLTGIMTKLVNCDTRIGTSGTLQDSKVHKLILEGLFGPVKKVVDTKTLIDQNHLASLDVKCIVLGYSDSERAEVKKTTYQEEIEFLIFHEARNRFIRNLALSLEGNSLVLFNYVEKHGKGLYESIRDKAKDGRKVFYVHGGVDVEDREAIRAITEKEKNAIIVASYGVFSTGVNIRNLHNIIAASPTKSKIRLLQSIGRVLRIGDNKDKATFYDIADDLRSKSYDNFTIKHFEERVKYYTGEQFPFSIHNVRIS